MNTLPELPQNSKKATISWNEDGELVIEWLDGHSSRYTLAYLRRACPCARCKSWPEREADGFPKLAPERIKHIWLKAVNPVGRYALHFVWSDGHQTGYYPYDYLRRICPCAACRRAN